MGLMSTEAALLGAIMANPDRMAEVAGVITPDDFESAFNARTFTAICDLHAEGLDIDLVTVRDRMPDDHETRARLVDLYDAAATSAHVVSYARQIAESGARRRLSRALRVASEQRELADMLSEANTAIQVVEGGGVPVARSLRTVLDERYTTLADPREYVWLADFPGPHLHFGSLVYLGARPGTGKSSFALAAALEWSSRGMPVRVYDFEMGELDWADRVIQARTHFTTDELDDGLDAFALDTVRAKTDSLEGPLTIVDAPAQRLSFDGLLSDIRRFARRGGRIVVIDYMQLAVEQSYEAVTEASRRLKLVAKECGVLVFAVSQLKRRFDDAGNPKPPTLGDLRQSGALEQDADTVILLHRYASERVPEVCRSLRADGYHVDDPAYGDRALSRVHFAKMRRGRTYRFPCWWDGPRLSFEPIDRTEG